MPVSSLSLTLPASLLALMAVASQARANCAMPVGYSIAVVGNTVTITPENFGVRSCPDSSGMLRENVETGELVRLADYCRQKPGSGADSTEYVDECVPAGTYRYGFAVPYTCHESSCGTYYYDTAEVTMTLDSDCQRTEGNSAPTTASSKPWKFGRQICDYGGESDGCTMQATRATTSVLAIQAGALLVGLWLRRRRQTSLER